MAEMNASIEIDLGRRRSRSRSRSRSPHKEKAYVVEVHRDSVYGNDRGEVVVQPRRAEVNASASNEVMKTPHGEKKVACLTMYDTGDRDPKRIADDVRVTFEDIIAEPDLTLFSFDQVWRVSKLVYTQTKLWVYRILTLLFGVPLAVLWGIVFAVISCCASWICVPCFKCYRIPALCCKRYHELTLDCLLEPFVVVGSKIFYNIRVHFTQSSG